MIDDLRLLEGLGRLLDFRPSGTFKRYRQAISSPWTVQPTIRDLLIEGLLKIQVKQRGLSFFEPNRAQQEYSRNCTKRNIVLKARQLGITTYVAARFFIQTITQPGTMTVQVAHNQESAEEIFKIVHRFWENLPEGTREGALVTSHANIRQIVFPRIDSEYRVATAADSNAGRGLTIHNLHCSEVARWARGGEDALASLRAAVPETGEIVLESTPNGAGGVFYEEWQRAEETRYTRHFFPWWYDSHYAVDTRKVALHPLAPEERDLMERVGLTEGQIAWRRMNRAQLRGLAAQEYAEDAVTCFKASGECAFDVDTIEQMLAGSGEPLEMRDNKRMMMWFPPHAEKQYIIGADPAGGGADGDYACAQVIERRTGMQCAELHGHFSPQEFAGRLIELAKSFNQALIVVERNNHGHGVLAHLRERGCANVYRDGKEDGWLTSAVSRPAMIENLAAILVTEPTLFHSPRLLNECRTFVRHLDGSMAAATGTHDDCVMAMAIALAARRAVAGNLSKRSMLEVASLPSR